MAAKGTWRGACLVAAAAIALAGCGEGGANRVAGGSAGSGGGAAPALAELDFEVIEQGDDSRYPGADELLLEDLGSWAAFWAQHDPSRPPPRIDLRGRAVLASLMGAMPSAGFGRTVVRVERELATGDVRALVRDQAPASWVPVPRIVTAPYAVAAIQTGGPTSGRLHTERQESLAYEELFSGHDNAAGLADPGYAGEVIVARSQAEYDALWRRIAPNRRPPAQPANLDFARQQVVAVLAPHRTQFYGGLVVHRVLADQHGELRVCYTVEPYRGGAAPPPGPFAPWAMVRTNATPAGMRARFEQPRALPRRTLARGHGTYHGPRMLSVARDDASYRAWQGALGQPLPPVDFATEQVVIAFAGNSPFGTTYSSVEVSALELLEDGELVVEVSLVTNTAGPSSADSPYHYAAMPRTHGPVTFRLVDATPRP
ncbi:MAG: hypothetical protein KatS3mg102_1834 [Planctomycetota bacterium]|nr:MAG: hypothetical protein KatS3mg102_1834 [Planctomycetota bacterium]